MEVGMSFFKVEEKLSQWCVLEACHTEVAYVRGWSLQRPLLEFGACKFPHSESKTTEGQVQHRANRQKPR